MIVIHHKVYEDYTNLLMGENPDKHLDNAFLNGRFCQIPPIMELASFQHNDIQSLWGHTLTVVSRTPAVPVLRWAAFLHDAGKPYTWIFDSSQNRVTFPLHQVVGAKITKDVLNYLFAPNPIRDCAAKLVANHHALHSYTDQWPDSSLRSIMDNVFPDIDLLFQLCRADITNTNQSGRRLQNLLNKAQDRCNKLKRPEERMSAKKARFQYA